MSDLRRTDDARGEIRFPPRGRGEDGVCLSKLRGRDDAYGPSVAGRGRGSARRLEPRAIEQFSNLAIARSRTPATLADMLHRNRARHHEAALGATSWTYLNLGSKSARLPMMRHRGRPRA